VIIDHDNRFERIAQHLRERARHDIGRPARRKRHDQADLLARERLRRGWFKARQQSGAERPCRRGQEMSAPHEIPHNDWLAIIA
jgi:hypothetical protein